MPRDLLAGLVNQPAKRPPVDLLANVKPQGSYWGDVAKNALPSTGNVLNQFLVQPTLHPIQTGRGIVDLASGVAGRSAQGVSDIANLVKGQPTKPILGGGLQPDIAKAEQAGEYYKDRYGGLKKIAKSFRSDPAGVLTDAAMVAQGGGALLKGAATAGKLGTLARIGGGIEKAGELANPAIGAAKLGGKVLGATAKAVPKAMINTSARLVNSLIKPLKKDFSYGKNAGEGVVREGIVATSFDDLASKIANKTKELGQSISTIVNDQKYANKTINNSNIVEKLDSALADASKSPKTNSALIQRLVDAKDDILGGVDAQGFKIYTKDVTKMTPAETFELKRQIGDITKFTGNLSDDAIVNKALKQTYGQLKENLNKAVPELKDLNERYADIKTADIAIKYRDKILQRQNAIGIFPKLMLGGGTGAAFGGVPGGIIGTALAAGTEALASSTPFKTGLAQGLYRGGKGMQAIGSKLREPIVFNPAIDKAKWQRGSIDLGGGLPEKGGEINSLIQEAKKYRTVEDYINKIGEKGEIPGTNLNVNNYKDMLQLDPAGKKGWVSVVNDIWEKAQKGEPKKPILGEGLKPKEETVRSISDEIRTSVESKAKKAKLQRMSSLPEDLVKDMVKEGGGKYIGMMEGHKSHNPQVLFNTPEGAPFNSLALPIDELSASKIRAKIDESIGKFTKDKPAITESVEIPTFAEAQKLIPKEGGYANLKSLPAINRAASEQIGQGLNPKYLYEQATKKGINLNDWMLKIDATADINKKLDISQELMSELSISEVVNIPKFKGTKDAVAFGKANKDNPAVIKKLKDLREQAEKESDILRKEKKYQEALDKGNEAQFYREALEYDQVGSQIDEFKRKLKKEDL